MSKVQYQAETNKEPRQNLSIFPGPVSWTVQTDLDSYIVSFQSTKFVSKVLL